MFCTIVAQCSPCFLDKCVVGYLLIGRICMQVVSAFQEMQTYNESQNLDAVVGSNQAQILYCTFYSDIYFGGLFFLSSQSKRLIKEKIFCTQEFFFLHIIETGVVLCIIDNKNAFLLLYFNTFQILYFILLYFF